jgi:hypothetical protein
VRGLEQIPARFGVPEHRAHQNEERDGQQPEVVERGEYEVGKESKLCRSEEDQNREYRGDAKCEGNGDTYGQHQQQYQADYGPYRQGAH